MAETGEGNKTGLLAMATGRGAGPFVLVIALLAVLSLLGQKPSQEPRRGGQAGGVDSVDGTFESEQAVNDLVVLGPLREYLGLEAKASSFADFAKAVRGGNHTLRVLLATLPDPHETRLADSFDSNLEAIQRALEKQGFVIDRFRMTWGRSGSATQRSGLSATSVSRSPAPGSDEPAVEESSSRPTESIYDLPTSILFRKSRDKQPDELLLLLISGESPSKGINKYALRSSLRIADALASPDRRGPAKSAVQCIVGPSFTGSADSLARELSSHQWQTTSWLWSFVPAREYWICSGTATAVNKERFEELAKPAVTRYAATVVPDALAMKALFEWLIINERSRVVFLVEGGTGYGSALASEQRHVSVINVAFPLHISQVRSTSAPSEPGPLDAPRRGVLAIPLDESPAARDQVPMQSPRRTAVNDALVLQNTLHSLGEQDVRYIGIAATDVLDKIYLTQLIRDHCPNTQVFLLGGDLLVSHPSATFDLRGTIVVSSYPLDTEAQLWTYPFQGQHRQLMFSNDGVIGTHNAVHVLMDAKPKDSNQLEMTHEAGRAGLIQYGSAFPREGTPASRPSIWINRVGMNEVVAVRSIALPTSWKDADELTRQAMALLPAVITGDNETVTTSIWNSEAFIGWRVGLFVLTLASLGFVAAVGFANRYVPSLSSSNMKRTVRAPVPWLLVLRLRDNRVTARRLKALLLMMLAATLATALIAFALPALFMPTWNSDRVVVMLFGVGRLLLAFLALAALTATILLLAWTFIRPRYLDASNQTDLISKSSCWSRRVLFGKRARPSILSTAFTLLRLVLIAAVSMTFAFVALRFWSNSSWAHAPELILTANRVTKLGNGLSPLLPVLLLVATWLLWAAIALCQVHQGARPNQASAFFANPENRLGPGVASQFTDLRERFAELHALLASPWPWWRWARGHRLGWSRGAVICTSFVLAVLATLLVEILWVRFIPTTESALFDTAFRLAFASLTILLTISLVQLIVAWRRLNRLFRASAGLPLSKAFAELPEDAYLRFGRFLKAEAESDESARADGSLMTQVGLRIVEDLKSAKKKVRKAIPESLLDSESQAKLWLEVTRESTSLKDACRALREAGQACAQALNATEATEEEASPSADENLKKPNGIQATPETKKTERSWRAGLDELFALFLVRMLRRYAAPVRRLTYLVTFGPLLLLLAISWYPFQPQHELSLLVWSLILSAMGLTLFVLVQIDRDTFVSRVAHTQARSVSFDLGFFTSVLPLLTPLLLLVLTAFPGISDWIKPLFEPLHHLMR